MLLRVDRAPPLFRGRLLLAPRGGGRAGGRGLLAARRPATPRRPLTARAGVCRVCWVDFSAAPGPLARGPAAGGPEEVSSEPGPGGSRCLGCVGVGAHPGLPRLLPGAESWSEL